MSKQNTTNGDPIKEPAMKATNLKKITQELEKGFRGTTRRNGIEYAWYSAGNLDEGLRLRAEFAGRWREAVLALAEGGEVTEASLTMTLNFKQRNRKFHKAKAYYVGGKLALLIQAGKREIIEANGRDLNGVLGGLQMRVHVEGPKVIARRKRFNAR
jgi:hypothetical protein